MQTDMTKHTYYTVYTKIHFAERKVGQDNTLVIEATASMCSSAINALCSEDLHLYYSSEPLLILMLLSVVAVVFAM